MSCSGQAVSSTIVICSYAVKLLTGASARLRATESWQKTGSVKSHLCAGKEEGVPDSKHSHADFCRATTSSAPVCRSKTGSWLLEQKLAGPAMLGMREGGLTGAAYYVLSREGPDFVAVPVSQWLSFRPQRQCVPWHKCSI